ncbi:MAG: glucosamine-6-phosphate deaminase [Bacteroidetes bacterium]|nr:MAG: glucosamine-6-phosphate deaminase [Bacteroidota bacterium]
MKVFVSDSYDEMSKVAAEKAVELLFRIANPLVCIASGDTPTGMYRNFVKMKNSSDSNIANWNFIALDEWVGMNQNDEGSCGNYLFRTLLEPMNKNKDEYTMFDGKAQDLQNECTRVLSFISKKGGKIDLAILGLGVNGHLGLNEPGTSDHHLAHVSQLSDSTKSVGQKYFSSGKELTQGITLGLATLMNAKTVFLIVNGAHKKAILNEVINGEISKQIPGTILQKHPNCFIFTDRSAAS